jgi:hypothetical protein
MKNRIRTLKEFRPLGRLILLSLLCVFAIMATDGCRPRRTATTLENALRTGNKDFDDYVKAGRLSAVIEHSQA